MQNIEGDDKTVEVLLSGAAFGIDYYQREYRWKKKQLQELVDDLHGQFLQTWNSSDPDRPLEKQSKYFLGSIVVSKTGDLRYIVDGQQRITTLILLLIHLNHLQKEISEPVEVVRTLIYAQEPGGRKFKLDIEDRNECMAALLNGRPFNPDGYSDSVKNLVERYEDLEEIFPKDMAEDELRMFIWWLIRNVKLIEITAHDDGDAYTIFETMNDRGLSLSPTDMLKGYLLANIDDQAKRFEANKLIKKYLEIFAEYGKETEADFFKTWLRSQYAMKIREKKKDANPEDFDKIGTEYHRWVRDNQELLKLENGNDFYRLVSRDLRYFADLYLTLLKASETRTPGLESVKYNADAGFTLQHHILLAAVSPVDDKRTAHAKMAIVADYIDCWLNRRLWNYKSTRYSNIKYPMFQIILEIREKSETEIKQFLHERLLEEMEDHNFSTPVRLNQYTSKAVHRQLARFMDWLEQQSGEPGKYEHYIVRSGKNAYEVEHIWANHYDRFSDEFDQQNDFDLHRNHIGGLLLLPKKINASLNDMTYTEKLPHYLKQNLLAQSLHPECYQNNPGFKQTIDRTELPFHHHEKFTKSDLEERSKLYCQLATVVWSHKRLLDDEEGA